ncbi:MAG TPA: NAD(P)H-dependent glycerol-3-phosphate dehydrogenase [Acidisarcina sp.]
MSRIAILGTGAWGTALAISLSRRGGHAVTLLGRSEATSDALNRDRENKVFLPGFPLAPEIAVTADVAGGLDSAEIIVSTVPSQYLRPTFERIAPYFHARQILVSATKGIEDGTFLRMSEVIAETLAGRGFDVPVGVLSGPSFAQEVASGFPTAVTIAFEDTGVATRIQREFSSPTLRLYTNEDVIGVELGGALKNVVAISSGVVTGLGLGHSSAAALMTRGIAEIIRLAVACRGRRETLAGLSGLGDLVLTCTGALSRNRAVGIALGQGRPLPEILAGLEGKVAEGVRTTSAALGLAAKHGVEMPITKQVEAILHQARAPRDAIQELMGRPGRDE